jgi:nucleotide-binding universal stress UspA family protein
MFFHTKERVMKVLLPVDGSEGSLAAVRHAIHLTREGLRASFVLANVQEPASLYEVVVAHDAQVLESVSEAAGADALQAAQALLLAAGAEFESEIASGDPGHMLADMAERFGCDLVVMGARGAGAGSGRAVLGSVAHAVLHAALDVAPMPVTIVRRPEG